MQHPNTTVVPGGTGSTAPRASRRAGAPVWVLLVGLALLVLAVGPQLVSPVRSSPVRPAATAATAAAPAAPGAGN